MTENERDQAIQDWVARWVGPSRHDDAEAELRHLFFSLIESALTEARRAAIEEFGRTSLLRKLCVIVDGWGETRHPKTLGFGNYGSRTGLTCGDVYEIVELVRSLASPSPGKGGGG